MRGDQIALLHADDGGHTPADLDDESRNLRVPLGQGIFPLSEFVAVLEEIGYDGPVSVEVLSAELRKLSPHDYARALHESVRAWRGPAR
jgi:sugar phosphate isomerase/epimerase